MEVVVWTAVTGLLWISSMTILLPFLCILKYNKYLRNRWFSFLFTQILKYFEPQVLPLRKKTFDLLKANLPERDSTNPIKILEIGIGSGANLMFYPENSRLTGLDMNTSFESYFRQNQAKYPQVSFDRLVTSYAEDMKDIEDSSMDIVISTYVLCSVKSVEDSLREIKRVLKPGGKHLFLEHIGFPKSGWKFSLQKMAAPLLFIYGDGCNVTRHLIDDIKKAYFGNVECYKIFPNYVPLFVKPQIYGLATK